MKISFLLSVIIPLMLSSCSSKENVNIVVNSDQTIDAAKDLIAYLSETYTDKTFQLAGKEISGEKNIELQIVDNFENDEAYKIAGDENLLVIKGNCKRCLRFA